MFGDLKQKAAGVILGIGLCLSRDRMVQAIKTRAVDINELRYLTEYFGCKLVADEPLAAGDEILTIEKDGNILHKAVFSSGANVDMCAMQIKHQFPELELTFSKVMDGNWA